MANLALHDWCQNVWNPLLKYWDSSCAPVCQAATSGPSNSFMAYELPMVYSAVCIRESRQANRSSAPQQCIGEGQAFRGGLDIHSAMATARRVGDTHPPF